MLTVCRGGVYGCVPNSRFQEPGKNDPITTPHTQNGAIRRNMGRNRRTPAAGPRFWTLTTFRISWLRKVAVSLMYYQIALE